MAAQTSILFTAIDLVTRAEVLKALDLIVERNSLNKIIISYEFGIIVLTWNTALTGENRNTLARVRKRGWRRKNCFKG